MDKIIDLANERQKRELNNFQPIDFADISQERMEEFLRELCNIDTTTEEMTVVTQTRTIIKHDEKLTQQAKNQSIVETTLDDFMLTVIENGYDIDYHNDETMADIDKAELLLRKALNTMTQVDDPELDVLLKLNKKEYD